MYTPSFKRKRSKVPVLSKPEIEEIAENYIRDFCPEALTTPQAVDVETFTESYLRMHLDYQFLSNDGRYLGMTVFNDTDRIIIYDPKWNRAKYFHADARTVIIDNSIVLGLPNSSLQHRYRYTLGHECGHGIFHAAYYQCESDRSGMSGIPAGERPPCVQCRASSIAGSLKPDRRQPWEDSDWMEWQANYFASVFLMPRTALLKFAAGYLEKNCCEKNLAEATLVESVVKTFDVSMEAAIYRCRELSLVGKDTNPSSVYNTLDYYMSRDFVD